MSTRARVSTTGSTSTSGVSGLAMSGTLPPGREAGRRCAERDGTDTGGGFPLGFPGPDCREANDDAGRYCTATDGRDNSSADEVAENLRRAGIQAGGPERDFRVGGAFDTYTTPGPYRAAVAAWEKETEVLAEAARQLADALDAAATDYDASDARRRRGGWPAGR